jgi:lipopolysaccharide heptosyltransferase II
MKQEYASTRSNKTGFPVRSSHGLTWHDVHRGLVYLLSWLLQKWRFRQSISDSWSIKKILVFQPGKIGDLIMTLPFLRSLKDFFPRARITLVVHPVCRGLAALEADEVISYCSPLYHHCRPGENGHLSQILPRGKAYDLLVDLKSDFSSLWYSFRHGRRYRIDLASLGMTKYLRKFVSRIKCQAFQNPAPRHHTELMGEALERISGKPVAIPESWLSIPGAPEVAAKLRRQFGLASDKRLVILHPGGSLPLKLWPLEKFAALADRLVRQAGVAILATGDASEAEVGSKLSRLMHSPLINLIGRFDLLELAALISQSALVVANDSSVAHLAAAVGTPVIVLFGPTDPDYCAPRGRGVDIIRAEIDCSPCPQRECHQPPGSACMELIAVGEVFRLAQKKLAFPPTNVEKTKIRTARSRDGSQGR